MSDAREEGEERRKERSRELLIRGWKPGNIWTWMKLHGNGGREKIEAAEHMDIFCQSCK